MAMKRVLVTMALLAMVALSGGMLGCSKPTPPPDEEPLVPVMPREEGAEATEDVEAAEPTVEAEQPEVEPAEEPEVTEEPAPPSGKPELGKTPEETPKEKPATKAEKAPAAPVALAQKPPPAPEKPRPATAKAPEPRASTGVSKAPTKAPAEKVEKASGGTQVIATVEIASNVPEASEVPYTECVTFVKYRVESVVSGSYDGDEILAVLWGMRDSKRKPAADFKPGQRHKLTIEPFSKRGDLARVMQADDTDEYSLEPQWVTNYSSP